jgi:hypothetical protein
MFNIHSHKGNKIQNYTDISCLQSDWQSSRKQTRNTGEDVWKNKDPSYTVEEM